MNKFLKKPAVSISAVIVIILIIGGYFYFNRTKKPAYEFIVASKGNVVQEVSVTGRVKPAESVDLAFEKTGKVAGIYVDVGSKVFSGQILMQLSNADLVAQLAEAEANTKSQKAKLEELKQGTRPEEIQVYETKVENAKVSIEDAQKNLSDKIQDAYTKSDDAVRNKTDQLFSNPRTATPQLNYYLFIDSISKSDIEALRFLIEDLLNSWDLSLGQLTTSSDLISYIDTADKNLDQVKTFLDKIGLAINNVKENANLSQTTLDGWKADISTARANINTAIANLTAAEEKLKTAQSDLDVAENELALKKAGSVPQEIIGQEAEVESAEANANNIKAQINKSIIFSPINGVVTRQNTKVGEIVPANAAEVSVMSDVKFEIEANIPEADIAKIKINNPAKITLDAYGSDVVFEAKVVKIDPAETIIEGVATYKTTLQFTGNDDRVKSGMTANIDILTAKTENVMAIPQRAVAQKENGDKIVKILKDDGAIEERKVAIGLKGSDGNIEIIEGINEGDKVITSLK